MFSNVNNVVSSSTISVMSHVDVVCLRVRAGLLILQCIVHFSYNFICRLAAAETEESA